MKSKVYIYIYNSHGKFCKNPLFLVSYFFAPKKTPTKSEALPPTQRHFPANVYPHPQASQVTPDVEKTGEIWGMRKFGESTDKKVTQICFLILDDDIWYMWLYLYIYIYMQFLLFLGRLCFYFWQTRPSLGLKDIWAICCTQKSSNVHKCTTGMMISHKGISVSTSNFIFQLS